MREEKIKGRKERKWAKRGKERDGNRELLDGALSGVKGKEGNGRKWGGEMGVSREEGKKKGRRRKKRDGKESLEKDWNRERGKREEMEDEEKEN